jgi:hypothetical protein
LAAARFGAARVAGLGAGRAAAARPADDNDFGFGRLAERVDFAMRNGVFTGE